MTPTAAGHQSSARQPVARIAIDLLGGDHAPAVVVDGALEALDADPELRVLLVGPTEAVESVSVPPSLRARLEVVPAGSLVAADRQGAARGGTTSVADAVPVPAAMRAAVAGAVDAVVSAGSTGATVTAAVRAAGRLPGVASLALAVIVPASKGPVVLLDVGAVPERAVRTLASHALLGAAYAAAFLDLDAPRVGLLSIGEEMDKGDAVLRQTRDRLSRMDLPAGARFVGNVEGHQVPLGGPADVVVTDGFTGNVLLKAVEGTVALLGGDIPRSSAPRAALLLGVPATVVVCHGAAVAADLASGVLLAARAVRRGVADSVAAACRTTRELAESTIGSPDEEVRR